MKSLLIVTCTFLFALSASADVRCGIMNLESRASVGSFAYSEGSRSAVFVLNGRSYEGLCTRATTGEGPARLGGTTEFVDCTAEGAPYGVELTFQIGDTTPNGGQLLDESNPRAPLVSSTETIDDCVGSRE